MKNHSILVLPEIREIGGPGTFKSNFVSYCLKVGINVVEYKKRHTATHMLLINGSRKLFVLLIFKLLGKPIIQRLGSPINLESHLSRPNKDKIISYCRLMYIKIIRRYIADAIIYQSEFVRNEWKEIYDCGNKSEVIIYNPVNLNYYQRNLEATLWTNSGEELKLVSIEGTQGNDPFDILFRLSEILSQRGVIHKIYCAGKPTLEFITKAAKFEGIVILGALSKLEICNLLHKSHINIQTDYLGAGCPNSALESLAAGIPVTGFAYGPLTEIIKPYESDLLLSIKEFHKNIMEKSYLESFADLLLRIMEEYELNVQRVSELRNRYSSEKILNEYIEFIIQNRAS